MNKIYYYFKQNAAATTAFLILQWLSMLAFSLYWYYLKRGLYLKGSYFRRVRDTCTVSSAIFF